MKRTKEVDDCGGILNVVFHGTLIFVPGPDGIEVLMPKIMGHAYLAGTYFKEQPLAERQGPYRLAGVTRGRLIPRFDWKDRLCYTGELVKGYGERLFCSWTLPLPASVRSVRQISVNEKYFTGADRRQLRDLKELALVHVLRYRFKQLKSVGIVNTAEGGTPVEWKPEFHRSSGTANLHVFAAPLPMAMREMSLGKHATMAFAEMTKLLQGANLGLRYPKNAPLDSLTRSSVRGLPLSEHWNLDERPTDDQGTRSHGFPRVNCAPTFLRTTSHLPANLQIPREKWRFSKIPHGPL